MTSQGESTEEGDEDFAIFVIINNYEFKVMTNKIVDAIDYCYKAFFALHLDFSKECKHLWVFLQTYVYKNALDDVRSYTVVTKCIEELEKFIKKQNKLDNNLTT